MKINQIILLLIAFLISQDVLHCQSKTNTQLSDSLIYLSVESIVDKYMVEQLNDDVIELNFIGADDYSILKSKVILFFQQMDVELVEGNNKNRVLNYNLDDVNVNYSEVFRDGLFGDFLVRRKVGINGLFNLNLDGNIGETTKFNFSIVDTVLYDDLYKLENIAYSFTSSQLPEQPFFSTVLEPAIAIGTAAIAVYLFFNIRSK